MAKAQAEAVEKPKETEQAPEEKPQVPAKRKTKTPAKRRASTPAKTEAVRTDRVLQLEAYASERKGVLAFIKGEFKPECDYGLQYEKSDKEVLLKPGMEKLCILFQIEPVWLPDTDMMQVDGMGGTVAMICFFLTGERKEQAIKRIEKMGSEHRYDIYRTLAVAEGRGACSLKEKKNTTPNLAIKITEKRALGDAVLRCFGLSDLFTVDMEEGDANGAEADPHADAPPETAPKATGDPRPQEEAKAETITEAKAAEKAAKTTTETKTTAKADPMINEQGQIRGKDGAFYDPAATEVAAEMRKAFAAGSISREYVDLTTKRVQKNPVNKEFLLKLKAEVIAEAAKNSVAKGESK